MPNGISFQSGKYPQTGGVHSAMRKGQASETGAG